MAKKRANGEGTIYQRQDDRWVGSLTPVVGPRQYFYGRTRADVSAKLVKAQQTLAGGKQLTNDHGCTLRVFLTEWVNTVRPSLRPLTHRYYTQKLQAHIIPRLGKVRLSELTTPLIQRQLGDLGKTLAPKTVKHCRDILRGALNDAMGPDRLQPGRERHTAARLAPCSPTTFPDRGQAAFGGGEGP